MLVPNTLHNLLQYAVKQTVANVIHTTATTTAWYVFVLSVS